MKLMGCVEWAVREQIAIAALDEGHVALAQVCSGHLLDCVRNADSWCRTNSPFSRKSSRRRRGYWYYRGCTSKLGDSMRRRGSSIMGCWEEGRAWWWTRWRGMMGPRGGG